MYVDVQRHFLWNESKEEECLAHALKSYLCMQESLVQDNGHLLVPVPKRSGIL